MGRMLFILILLFSFTACSNNTTETTTSAKDIEWEKKVIELGNQYSAIVNWEEKFDDALTIQLQNEFTDKVVLFKDVYLDDVFSEKGEAYAKFETFSGIYLTLKVANNDQLNKLIEANASYGSITLVTRVNKISTPMFSLYAGTAVDDYAPVEVSTDATSWFEGGLLDFILKNN